MVKRGDGRWQEKILIATSDGRKKYKYFYGHTKSEIYRQIASYEEEQEKGKAFEVVASEWWAEAEPQLSPNTLKGYIPAVNRAKSHFYGKPIKDITPQDISVFVRNFARETHAADKTTRTQLMMVNLICRYAVENGYIASNPARDVSVPKGLKKEKRLMPSEEDISRVKNNYDMPFGAFAYWLIYTGCRRSELLALTWEDVDLTARTIKITKSLCRLSSGKPELKPPKTEAGNRVVPLVDRLAEKIANVKHKSGLVFPNQDGNYMTESQVTRAWEKYRDITGVSCSPHQLRHAYATMLFECGIEPKEAQALLGHAQLSTTMDIYTEIRDKQQKAIAEKLLHIDID